MRIDVCVVTIAKHCTSNRNSRCVQCVGDTLALIGVNEHIVQNSFTALAYSKSGEELLIQSSSPIAGN